MPGVGSLTSSCCHDPQFIFGSAPSGVAGTFPVYFVPKRELSALPDPLAGGEGTGCPLLNNHSLALGLLGLEIGRLDLVVAPTPLIPFYSSQF